MLTLILLLKIFVTRDARIMINKIIFDSRRYLSTKS